MKPDFKKILRAFEDEPEIVEEEFHERGNIPHRIITNASWVANHCFGCASSVINKDMTAAKCYRKYDKCPHGDLMNTDIFNPAEPPPTVGSASRVSLIKDVEDEPEFMKKLKNHYTQHLVDK